MLAALKKLFWHEKDQEALEYAVKHKRANEIFETSMRSAINAQNNNKVMERKLDKIKQGSNVLEEVINEFGNIS